jgi:hypothetical protein
LAAAQSHAPVVTMSVTWPDRRTQELTAAESGLANDQSQGRFGMGLSADRAGQRAVESDHRDIFRTAAANAPTQILGEVELKRGGPAVDAKTVPSFEVAVPKGVTAGNAIRFDKLVQFGFGIVSF